MLSSVRRSFEVICGVAEREEVREDEDVGIRFSGRSFQWFVIVPDWWDWGREGGFGGVNEERLSLDDMVCVGLLGLVGVICCLFVTTEFDD